MIICDTNVLIEFYKGNNEISASLRQIGLGNLAVSAITVAELYFGAFNKQELRDIKTHLARLHQIPLNVATTSLFLLFMERYSLSHKLSVPDALIAATAVEHDLQLYTLNVKDFRFIDGLDLYLPKI